MTRKPLKNSSLQKAPNTQMKLFGFSELRSKDINPFYSLSKKEKKRERNKSTRTLSNNAAKEFLTKVWKNLHTKKG